MLADLPNSLVVHPSLPVNSVRDMIGLEVVASKPEQLAATLRTDIVKWGGVIREAKIRVE